MHICVGNLTIIGSDNGLSPGRRQAIIWTNAGILLIGPLGTNFSEILIEILTFSFKKMRLKVSSAKRRPFCLGLNVLTLKWHRKMNFFLKDAKAYLFQSISWLLVALWHKEPGHQQPWYSSNRSIFYPNIIKSCIFHRDTSMVSARKM